VIASEIDLNGDSINIPVETSTEGNIINDNTETTIENTEIIDEGNLSEIEDNEVDMYIHTPEEVIKKQAIWEEVNRDYLEDQAERKRLEDAGVYKKRTPSGKKRKRDPKDSAPADTPLEALKKMTEKKSSPTKSIMLY